jgi:hypothetical protein
MKRAEIRWRRLDEPAVEHAAVFFSKRAQILEGVVDGRTQDGRAYDIRYTVRCAADWTTRYAILNGRVEHSRFKILLGRDAATGTWTCNGTLQRQIRRCIDVDLGFSPITNTLPIRRLKLGVGGVAKVRAAWLRFPELEFEVLEQRYIRTGDSTYAYESDGGQFHAELEVDRMGIVVRYDRYWLGSVTIPAKE